MKIYQVIFVLTLFFVGSSINAQDSSKVVNMGQRFLVNVGGISEGVISKETLIRAGELRVPKHAEGYYVLASFRLTHVRMMDGTLVEFNPTTDGRLTEEMINEIKQAKNGDKLYFEFIKVKSVEGEELRQVEPIGLKIQD
ncbi:MAG TPA: hypothetical protein PKM97_04775 [Bacteroidia bacterium]|nr:hypothetical protein [Bacteroidia bacterium]